MASIRSLWSLRPAPARSPTRPSDNSSLWVAGWGRGLVPNPHARFDSFSMVRETEA